MPEFLIFAVAVSMCVLCFAVGFVAALVLRIAGHSAIPSRGASDAPATSLPAPPERQQPALVEAPPAPVAEAPAFALPQAPPISEQQPAPAFEHQPAAVSRPAPPLPLRPAARAVPAAGFPAAVQSAPAAKVFLFGDPQAEPVALPSFAPARPASHASAQAPKPHVAPARLAPAEIDLLPHRPQHARSGRAR